MNRVKEATKKVIHAMPHPLTMRAYHAWFWADRFPKYEYARGVYHGLPRLEAPRLALSGDDLFILGSGSSLNDISDARWDAIRSKSSFGFNFSALLDVVPDLYAFEDVATFTEVYAKLQEILAARPAYRDIPKVFVNSSERPPLRLPPFDDDDFWGSMPSWLRENCYSAMAMGTFARSPDELRQSLTYLDERGLWDGPEMHRIFKYRGTLTMMLSIGIVCGFQRICLCGIDLNNSAYFYEDTERFPTMEGFRSSKRYAKHATERTLYGAASMSDIVVALRDVVARPRGVEVFVEHASSALHPALDLAPESMFEVKR